MPILVPQKLGLTQLSFTAFLLLALGCVPRNENHDPKKVAISHASKALSKDKPQIILSYHIRETVRQSLVEFEFFSKQLVKEQDLDEAESMLGGFPDYFSITIDKKSLRIVEQYMSPE